MSLASSYGWTGMLFDQISGITPIANTDSNYTVPSGKTLVITSTGSNIVRILSGDGSNESCIQSYSRRNNDCP